MHLSECIFLNIEVAGGYLSEEIWGKVSLYILLGEWGLEILVQGSSTCGARAACGPLEIFARPGKGISQNTMLL